MDKWQDIKNQIISYSKDIGIDKIGFTTGEPFWNIEKILREHQSKGYNSGFEEKNLNLRLDPALSLPGVQSIISVALAYPSRLPDCTLDSKKARGLFCRASWGQDYHLVLREKLVKLEQFIKSKEPGAGTLIMVDTGPLSDRAVAYRAGLGWLGKNGSLITEEYGSFVFLGELITTLPLEPDRPVSNQCGQCNRCLKACPMDAIIDDNWTINCQKCLGFQTLNKGCLSDEVKEKIAGQKYIYGCDVCQLVCPFNQDKRNDWHSQFKPDYELINPVLEEIINISNRDFQKKFGFMSGSWRGKKILQRNAILILGKEGNSQDIPLLKNVLANDSRPEIRAAAAWSLGQFKQKEARDILKTQLNIEKEDNVLEEIRKAIDVC
ncbi:MAG: tRNA epoxyqueuosine(34) reductase QueG [Clostridia bacterium]|nr:tRNA epoxyqueuosine(34) reductase QueG [Clostridia bacterium]